MQKLHCLLRYDSLLFIGFPVGRDEVIFNAHRIYGNVRMAMMFAGWRLQAVYYDDRPEPYDFSGQDFNEKASGRNGDRQLLFVLKKN